MQEREEILIPPNCNSVFRNPAEAFKDSLIKRLVEFRPGIDRTRRFICAADEIVLEWLNLQTINADNAETFIDEVMSKRVACRSHTDHQNVLAVVRQNI